MNNENTRKRDSWIARKRDSWRDAHVSFEWVADFSSQFLTNNIYLLHIHAIKIGFPYLDLGKRISIKIYANNGLLYTNLLFFYILAPYKNNILEIEINIYIDV